MKLNFLGLLKSSSNILKQLQKAEELKKFGNKNNYSYKIQKLKARLTNEFKFWANKGSSAKLNDIEKDIKLLSPLQHKIVFTFKEETQINTLISKYPID